MEETIDLRDLIQIIKKRLWIIILVTLLCGATSGIISIFALDRVYQASTTLMVSKTHDDQSNNLQYNDILMNQRLVKTYTEIAKSDRVLLKVLEKLAISAGSDSLRNKISVSSVADTEIIKIDVKDKDPEVAMELANTVAIVFMEEIGGIMRVDNVQFIDQAKKPLNYVKPNIKSNIVMALIFGFMVTVFGIFLLEAFDNTIKIVDDIEGKIGLPVLGSIPAFEE